MKNQMRNEQELQNYSPSTMRCTLLGKKLCVGLTTRKTANDFRQMYREAIEDLEAGYHINGCGEKNLISYWKEQFRLLDEFLYAIKFTRKLEKKENDE
jgi:hypothetical protein